MRIFARAIWLLLPCVLEEATRNEIRGKWLVRRTHKNPSNSDLRILPPLPNLSLHHSFWLTFSLLQLWFWAWKECSCITLPWGVEKMNCNSRQNKTFSLAQITLPCLSSILASVPTFPFGKMLVFFCGKSFVHICPFWLSHNYRKRDMLSWNDLSFFNILLLRSTTVHIISKLLFVLPSWR